MKREDYERLPALTGCPGKPACDQEALCADHRDVFRAMQKIDAEWRDMVIAAREARDKADAEVGRLRQAIASADDAVQSGKQSLACTILCDALRKS